MGSASELEYHLLPARDLKLIQDQDYAQLAQQTTELKRMLAALLQKLKADPARCKPVLPYAIVFSEHGSPLARSHRTGLDSARPFRRRLRAAQARRAAGQFLRLTAES